MKIKPVIQVHLHACVCEELYLKANLGKKEKNAFPGKVLFLRKPCFLSNNQQNVMNGMTGMMLFT